jgi:hypothetical protein
LTSGFVSRPRQACVRRHGERRRAGVSVSAEGRPQSGFHRRVRLAGASYFGVEEVEKKAKGLSKDEIQDLLDYEKQHKNCKTLVEALDREL